MLKKLKSYEDIALALVNEGHLNRSLDFIQDNIGQLTGGVRLKPYFE